MRALACRRCRRPQAMAIPCHNRDQSLVVTLCRGRHGSGEANPYPAAISTSTTHRRATNPRPARALQRSARGCPPGSSQGAGAAQGLWGPSATGRGQDHLDRVLGVGLPGGMDGHRPGPRPGPDPVADHLATQQQPSRRATVVDRPGALGDQRPGGHPDRGQPKHGAKVEGKAGAAGMVASGGIDHQHLEGDRRARTACSSSGPSRSASRARQTSGDAGTTVAHHYGGHPVKPELATWPMFRLNRGATLPRIGAVEAVGNER
jgi:hypothetical protein